MSLSMKITSNSTVFRLLGCLSVVGVLAGTLSLSCLSRPISEQSSTTNASYSKTRRASQITKIDLLLAIDDSSSMKDKQNFLADAVPRLVGRLVTPVCVDPQTRKANGETSTLNVTTGENTCTNGEPEFKAITDIHVGVVSSSLGDAGVGGCKANNTANKDLKAHLFLPSGQSVKDSGGFLAWYPSVPQNAAGVAPKDGYTAANQFSDDFKKIIPALGQVGCGYESQLESWYRFLIQPDPYLEIKTDTGARASYLGYDESIIKQRADFLRPDSLVAIIQLTDEDDSAVDPKGALGVAPLFMSINGDGGGYPRPNGKLWGNGVTIKRGTAACATDPGSSACRSCYEPGTEGDENCKNPDPEADQSERRPGYYAPKNDAVDARFQHMKARFGIDPQYPIERYVKGLTSARVPTRDGERSDCLNPLFAATLPTSVPAGEDALTKLCQADGATGSRDASLIFYAIIGGVPQDLVSVSETDPTLKNSESIPWEKILGRNPEKYDYTGIDARMYPSPYPRTAEYFNSKNVKDVDFSGRESGAPWSREWDTQGGDLNYACTFKLPTPYRPTDPDVDTSTSFDCSSVINSPLCNVDITVNGGKGRTQVRAKAYPTVRELRVAKGLTKQGIVASICPGDNYVTDTNNPNYGYNPAVNGIVDRLKEALNNQCLPQPLKRGEGNQVSCLILQRLKDPGDQSACSTLGPSITSPDSSILKRYVDIKTEENSSFVSDHPVCLVKQLAVEKGVSCKDSAELGWCYVSDVDGMQCKQAIEFTKTSPIQPNATVDFICTTEVGGN